MCQREPPGPHTNTHTLLVPSNLNIDMAMFEGPTFSILALLDFIENCLLDKHIMHGLVFFAGLGR